MSYYEKLKLDPFYLSKKDYNSILSKIQIYSTLSKQNGLSLIIIDK